MAEREGFEPSVEFPPHILSRDAQSATLSPLLWTWSSVMVRVDGIEPTTSAWKADVLPLNYTRDS